MLTLDDARRLDFTRAGNFSRFMLLAREPWRELAPWRPDDMPSRGGSPAALAKLAAECGDTEGAQ